MFGLQPMRHISTLPTRVVPAPSSSVGNRFSKRTLVGALGNGRDAPMIGIGGTSRCHPSHTTGHTGHVPGGSTRLSLVGNMKSRETERIEVVVAQSLLDRRVS